MRLSKLVHWYRVFFASLFYYCALLLLGEDVSLCVFGTKQQVLKWL